MKAGVFITPNHNLVYVAKDRTVKAVTLQPSTWVGEKVSYRRSDDTVLLGDYRCERYADVPNGCKDHAGYLAKLDEDRKAVIEPPPRKAADELPGFELGGRGPVGLREGEVACPLLGPDDGLHDYQREAVEDMKRLDDRMTVPVGLGRKAAMLRDDPYKKFADTVYRGPVLHKPRRVGSPPVLGYGYGITTKTDASRLRDLWRRRWESNLRAQGFRIVSAASARKHRKKGRAVYPLGGGRYAWLPCEATCTQYDAKENYRGL